MPDTRRVHLVGTLPYDDEEAAMGRAIELMGEHLSSLPDGEIGKKTERHPKGERLGWIQWIVERFEDSPAFEMTTEPKYESKLGLWADYDSVVRYKLKVRAKALPEHLDFGLVEYFERSFPIFQTLRDEHGLDGLRFQFGVPGALALSLFSLGPVHGIRVRSIFEDQLAAECNRIREAGGDDVVFQVEVPVELGMVLKAPRLARPLLLKRAAKWAASLAHKLEPGTPIGVHLCFGDLNNRPFVKVDSTEPVVHFANSMIEQWPADRPMPFLHVPLAMANIAPSLDPGFYAALADLKLPERTRFGAGFVHEGRTQDEHERILEMVEDALGRRVDVSTACGLGRRDRDEAEALMQEMARLAEA